jgi:mRNA-degrading endonuclease toxin of MazEF toxin-antitoxin module
VLAALTRGDVILCQIASQAAGHPEAVPILLADFEVGGGLRRASFALPHRVVTANEVCVRRAVGRLKPEKLAHIWERVCAIIRQS